jgi:hypothetical protein
MERFLVPALAIWLCVAVSIAPADAANGPGLVVLPAVVEGWAWDGQEAHYDARTVFDYIDGAGELYLAYGFEQLAVRRLEKADQPPLTIECYRMASAEGAFGVFSFEPHPGGRHGIPPRRERPPPHRGGQAGMDGGCPDLGW